MGAGVPGRPGALVGISGEAGSFRCSRLVTGGWCCRKTVLDLKKNTKVKTPWVHKWDLTRILTFFLLLYACESLCGHDVLKKKGV